MKQILILMVVSLLTISCSGTIFRQVSIDNDESTMVLDARQRVILITQHGGPTHNRKIICAEPSPDVAVALAAEGRLAAGFKAGGKKIVETADVKQEGEISKEANVDAGFKSSETLMNISQRTQTIQLLRDSLFRACEAHMNGLLDKEEYKDMLNSYDEFVITMLAIDGISASSDPSPAAIQEIIKLYLEQQKWYIEKKLEQE